MHQVLGESCCDARNKLRRCVCLAMRGRADGRFHAREDLMIFILRNYMHIYMCMYMYM